MKSWSQNNVSFHFISFKAIPLLFILLFTSLFVQRKHQKVIHEIIFSWHKCILNLNLHTNYNRTFGNLLL